MNLLCKIFSGSYDNLWRAIIRPNRDNYSIKDLGPYKFEINSKNFKRTDLIIPNKRNCKLKCSFWEPFDEEREYEQLPCVIYLHGNSSSRIEALGQLKNLLPLNITVFAFDFYGCGKSEGDYISLGWHESDDVECVINFLIKTNKVSTIGLWGRSMGAVTALIYASRKHNHLSAILIDSAFYSLKKLIEELIEKNINMPSFIINSLIQNLQKTIQEKAGFDIYDLQTFLFAQKCKVPAFFCHGKEDTLINVHHCQDLYDIYPGEKNISLLKGDHNTIRSKEFKNIASIYFYHYLNLNDLKINKLIKDNNFIQKANLSNKNLIRNHSSINLYKNKNKSPNNSSQVKMENNNEDISLKDNISEKNEIEKETLTSTRNMNYFQNYSNNDLGKINIKNKKFLLNKDVKEIVRLTKNSSETNVFDSSRIKLRPIELNTIKKLRTASIKQNIYFKKNIHNPFSKTETKIKPLINKCNFEDELSFIKKELSHNNRYNNNCDIFENSNRDKNNNILNNNNKNNKNNNNIINSDILSRKELKNMKIKNNSMNFKKNPFLFKFSKKKKIENEKQKLIPKSNNLLSSINISSNIDRSSKQKWVIFEGINPFLKENKDYFKSKLINNESSIDDEITIKNEGISFLENNEEFFVNNSPKK